MLDVPKGIPLQGLPDLDNLSFFEPSERFFTERIHKINEVVKAIEIVIAGRPLIKKVITTRFGNGLPEVDRRHLVERFEGLDKYHKSLIT